MALCGRHHRAVHRAELTIAGNPDQPRSLQFTDGRGRPIGPSPPRPPDSRTQPTASLGDNAPRYEPRSGERADWRWFWWRDPWLPDLARAKGPGFR